MPHIKDTELTVPEPRPNHSIICRSTISKKDKPSGRNGPATVRKVSPEEMERMWYGGKNVQG